MMTVPFARVSDDSQRLQRAVGRSRVGFRRRGETTHLGDLWQEGSAKIRLPRVHDDGGPVAVLINTAGGITGGDVFDIAAAWGEGAAATVTAQAAERIYRRRSGVGIVSTRLELGPAAWGAWLPQETIIFDGAGLHRRLDVTMSATATLVACEAVVLGRTAMGEIVRTLALRDDWRIRRDGRLVFADSLRLDGDSQAILAGGATGGGAAAFATLVRVSADAENRLGPVRAALGGLEGGGLEAGATAFDGVLVVRLLARDGRALRRALEALIPCLTDRPLPRVWML
jgi:urease accessory protein